MPEQDRASRPAGRPGSRGMTTTWSLIEPDEARSTDPTTESSRRHVRTDPGVEADRPRVLAVLLGGIVSLLVAVRALVPGPIALADDAGAVRYACQTGLTAETAGGPRFFGFAILRWSVGDALGGRVVRGGRYQRDPRGGWGARPIDRGARAGVRSRRPAGEGETMSGMYGADVAELRRLGQRLAEAADRLTALRGELDALVTSSPWEGPDGDELRGTWSTSHGPAVAAVGAVLGEAATAVVRQADQQESASTDGAGGPGGGDRGTPGGGDRGTPGDGDRPG